MKTTKHTLFFSLVFPRFFVIDFNQISFFFDEIKSCVYYHVESRVYIVLNDRIKLLKGIMLTSTSSFIFCRLLVYLSVKAVLG